jgi:hypothetical protein
VRFLEDGANVPDDLIRAVRDGSATFLCGAGVSFRVGLPSFKLLTEQVYDHLGESRADEPAERNAMASNEYDRALRSLEKRTHRPRTESRVRDAVAHLLAAPSGPFPDHLALLQLSRDAEGRPRLLTTNFDTLFERAAAAGGFNTLPSHAGKSIPKPGGERDFGILHLHGRIGDNVLKLPPSDLVLTSADFGDTYLRDGWASQYMEDRMRLGTLVLVGYAAEDAAMRLLLERSMLTASGFATSRTSTPSRRVRPILRPCGKPRASSRSSLPTTVQSTTRFRNGRAMRWTP